MRSAVYQVPSKNFETLKSSPAIPRRQLTMNLRARKPKDTEEQGPSHISTKPKSRTVNSKGRKRKNTEEQGHVRLMQKHHQPWNSNMEPEDISGQKLHQSSLQNAPFAQTLDITDYPGMFDPWISVISKTCANDMQEADEEVLEMYGHIMDLASVAIKLYNEKNETNFTVKKIDKLNETRSKCSFYHITFSCGNSCGPDETLESFQAKVLDDTIEERQYVLFCRPRTK